MGDYSFLVFAIDHFWEEREGRQRNRVTMNEPPKKCVAMEERGEAGPNTLTTPLCLIHHPLRIRTKINPFSLLFDEVAC